MSWVIAGALEAMLHQFNIVSVQRSEQFFRCEQFIRFQWVEENLAICY